METIFTGKVGLGRLWGGLGETTGFLGRFSARQRGTTLDEHCELGSGTNTQDPKSWKDWHYHLEAQHAARAQLQRDA